MFEVLGDLILVLIFIAIFAIPAIIRGMNKKRGAPAKKGAPANIDEMLNKLLGTPQQEKPRQPIQHKYNTITGEPLHKHQRVYVEEDIENSAEFKEDLTRRKLDLDIKEGEEQISHLSHLQSSLEEKKKKRISSKEKSPGKGEEQLEEKLAKLSPLKRAIIMSEILKPPKGLDL